MIVPRNWRYCKITPAGCWQRANDIVDQSTQIIGNAEAFPIIGNAREVRSVRERERERERERDTERERETDGSRMSPLSR